MRRAGKIFAGGIAAALIWGGLLLSIPAHPTQAQFATNTPDSPSVATQAPGDTATVTLAPLPTVTLGTVPADTSSESGPTAPLENYALRLWLEPDLIDVVYMGITALKNGDVTARLALQLTAYELQRRFPGAPTAPNARENLTQVMLQAPRGQVDIRWLARPYIMAQVGNRAPDETFEANNFKIELMPAHFNADALPDALLHVRYPASSEEASTVLYEEYLMIVGQEDGTYALLPEAFDLPSAPLDPVRALTLETLADVNNDTLDDVVLAVDDGDVNAHWYIITNRNGRMSNLVDPDFEIRVGEQISWDVTADSPDIPVLQVKQFRADSLAPNWDCRSEISVAWHYTNNYYRPTLPENGDYQALDSLGCRLFAAEPLFAQSPGEAVDTVQNALIDFTMSAPDSSRALMVLSMLYALNGQLTEARTAAEAVHTRAIDTDDPWAQAQSNAFLEALNVNSNTALDICAALAEASEDPACDIAAVLGRYLALAPLTGDADLLTQLDAQGFKPLDSFVVTEIGKAARTVVHFDYPNSGWWAFAAQRDGTFLVETADAPAVLNGEATPETAAIPLPASALTALMVEDNPRAALDIIESEMQNPGGRAFSGELRFARALCFDLIGDRTAATRAYYSLWSDASETLWGQMAGAHLEQRTQ